MLLTPSVRLFLPEILLSGAGLFLLGLDLSGARAKHRWVFRVSLLSLLGVLALVFHACCVGRGFGMLAADGPALFFKALALLAGLLIFLLSEADRTLLGEHAGSYAALILFSIVGIMLLASAEDLLILFVGLELATVPLFVLAAFLSPFWKAKESAGEAEMRSSEGAVKFFLVGAFSTGIALYGISLLYGAAGSTHFAALREWFLASGGSPQRTLFYLGLLFLIVGLGFKFSLVPFHQWTPDAYEGAPTPVTAFFSVSRDAGVIVVLLRLFGEFVNHTALGFTPLFFALSAVTMTAGNLGALKQTNLKRLLAYSSIAHAGTLLIGLVAANPLGRQGAMVYSLAYSLMSIGAFAVVIQAARVKGSEEIDAMRGLARENFPLALMMTFFLLSLSGIPPFLGFLGKFSVFAAAVESRLYWLVAIGLINSVIAVYYYFRIVHKMFFEETLTLSDWSGRKGGWIGAAAVLAAAAVLLLGVFPEPLLSWVRDASLILP